MKWFFVISTILFALFIREYVDRSNKIENIIYDLYSSNFNNYLTLDERMELGIDESKLVEYFKEHGYGAKVYEDYDGVHIHIKDNYIVELNKEYTFYKVKKHGYN